MRQIILVASLLTVFLCTTFQAIAQPDLVPSDRKAALKGDRNIALQDLHLTEDQNAKVKEMTTAQRTAVEEWNKQNQDKLDKLRADAKAAEQAGNKDEAQKLRQQLQTLQDARNAIDTKYWKDVIDLLNPEQKLTLLANREYQQGDYMTIRKQVQLTPEQEAQLKDQAKTYAAAEMKWDEANGEKARQLDQQIKEAQAALTALRAEQEKLNADNRTAILAILTPEQQTALAGAKLQQEMLKRLSMKLTEEQAGKCKPLCEAASKDISQLKPDDTKGRAEIVNKLYQIIVDQVLTDAQRAELQQRADQNQQRMDGKGK